MYCQDMATIVKKGLLKTSVLRLLKCPQKSSNEIKVRLLHVLKLFIGPIRVYVPYSLG